MTEKKCKICGEWVNSKKIAMHYWNIHHKKYNEYKDNEETREVEDVKIVNEEPPSTQSKTEEPIVKEPVSVTVEEPKVEVPTPKFETETVNEGLTEVPSTPEIPEANPWLETVKYFETPTTNETRNEIRQVVKHDLTDEGQTLNEWC